MIAGEPGNREARNPVLLQRTNGECAYTSLFSIDIRPKCDTVIIRKK